MHKIYSIRKTTPQNDYQEINLAENTVPVGTGSHLHNAPPANYQAFIISSESTYGWRPAVRTAYALVRKHHSRWNNAKLHRPHFLTSQVCNCIWHRTKVIATVMTHPLIPEHLEQCHMIPTFSLLNRRSLKAAAIFHVIVSYLAHCFIPTMPAHPRSDD